MDNLFYSIIVPSYNRQDEINELIASFLNLQFPRERYELIIVDDGSTDGTAALVHGHHQQKRIPLRYYSQDNNGPGAARNLGMNNARGDFFIFIDSDCTVDALWLTEIDDRLHATGADAFGAPDSCRDDFPPLLKAINYSMTSFLTTGGIRGHRKKKMGKFYPRSFNMGLSRKLYEQIGGFGSLRHGQDIEFSNRIINSGATVAHIETAIVYHKRRTSMRKFFKQVFNWGVARINLYKIDKKMLEPVHFLPAIGLWLTMFVLCLAGFLPVASLIFFLVGLTLLLFSAVDAGLRYKSFYTALYVPIIIPMQIFGYGAGFSLAFIKRVLLKKEVFTGFSKKYYQ